MKKLLLVLMLMLAAASPLLLIAPQGAAAQDCACFDLNNDGLCTDPPDDIVTNAELLAGPVSNPAETFLIPATCSIVLNSAPAGGVRVTGKRIVIKGEYISTPNGGEGVLFTAIEDVDVTGGRITSGGVNKLLPGVADNEAIAKSSIAFKAGTSCSFSGNASLQGNPAILFASSKVGIKCEEDIRICGSTIRAAGVNIQSDNGEINASVSGAAGPTIGSLCDDPGANLEGGGGPPGNANGVQDSGDFPCTLDLGTQFPVPITFNNENEKIAFCGVAPACPPNQIEALNNPLIMISKGDLNLAGQPGNENLLRGVFRVTLAAEDGNIDTSDTNITNEKITGGFIAGAKIWVFANPTSVNRLPVDKEDFLGPSSGTTDIDSACYESPNPIQHGDAGAPIVGVPDPLPCRQIGDFAPVLNGIF